METTYKSTLEINKLTQAQFNTAKTNNTLDANALYLTPEQAVTFTTSGGAAAGATYDGSVPVTVSYETVGAAPVSHSHYYAGSASVGGPANSVKTSLTFNNGGSGASSGTTYNGSTARTISYNTIGAAASGHTHTCSITNSSGTAVTSLAHGTTYTLTAGGNSVSFTMPSAGAATDEKVKVTTGNTYKSYVLGVYNSGYTSGNATSSIYTDTGVYLDSTAGRLTAASFYATSDKRLKENITPYSCEKSILDLPVYKYNFINDATKTVQVGCLAQDLQEICPELVSVDKEDGYLTISENKIIYLLLDEVKKLKAEVEELKAR